MGGVGDMSASRNERLSQCRWGGVRQLPQTAYSEGLGWVASHKCPAKCQANSKKSQEIQQKIGLPALQKENKYFTSESSPSCIASRCTTWKNGDVKTLVVNKKTMHVVGL